MAKDGTNRGGARNTAGRKPKPLHDVLMEGGVGRRIGFDESLEDNVVKPELHDFCDDVIPVQEIFDKVWDWLKERHCASLILPQLLEQYAMNCARWIDCEQQISTEGYTTAGPANKGTIIHPLVRASLDYSRHANQIWTQIYQVVKENCTVDYRGPTPMDDMEALLKELSE